MKQLISKREFVSFLLFSLLLAMHGASYSQGNFQLQPTSQVVWTSHRGRLFSASMPEQWQPNETRHGLDVIAPDGFTGNSFVVIAGRQGSMTPSRYLLRHLSRAGIRPLHWLSYRHRADQLDTNGQRWQVLEVELLFVYRGQSVRGYVLLGVRQDAGKYTVVMRSYQARSSYWHRLRSVLVRVDRSFVFFGSRKLDPTSQFRGGYLRLIGSGRNNPRLIRHTGKSHLIGFRNQSRRNRQQRYPDDTLIDVRPGR